MKSQELADKAERVFGDDVNITTEGKRHLGAVIGSKFTYCMRTIESFEEYVDPVQQVIDEMFLPTLFGQAEPLPDELSELVTLTPAQGGLGIPDLTTEAPQQYSASKTFTKRHVESIKFQSEIMNTNEQLVEELKRELRTLKAENTKSKIGASMHPSTLSCCVSHSRPETKVQVPGSKTRV